MNTIQVELNLPDEILTHLEHKAREKDTSLDGVISEIVQNYFDEPTEIWVAASTV